MQPFQRTLRSAVLAATLSWFAGAVQTASAAVELSVPSPAFAGGVFDVQLGLSSGGGLDDLTSLGGFDNGTLTLSFDPDVFEVPPGNQLQFSPSLPAPFATQPINTPSFVALAVIYMAPLPDNTPLGVIASGHLGVRPGAPAGSTELVFRFDFNGGDVDFDPVFNPLARTFQTSRDVVVAIPEASGWIMLLAGLAGIGLISRRRSRW